MNVTFKTGANGHIGRLQSRWMVLDGLQIHTRVSMDPVPGGRLPVVLVHGLGVSSRYMVPTAKRLAPYRRVYVPDLPGYGKSAKPAHVLNIAELSDALALWMQAAGLERADLIGNSLGCQILVDFALRYPQLMERAVLVGPTIDSKARTVHQQFLRVVLDSFVERPSQPFVVAYDYLVFGLPRALRTLHYALWDRVEDKLPHVRVPMLVVRGALDPIVPQDWVEDFAARLPNGRLVVIPGAPHTVNYSTPAELVRVVRPFLDGAAHPTAVPSE